MFKLIALLPAVALLTNAYPQYQCRFEEGVVIAQPPDFDIEGLNVVPDEDHPYMAPGPDDLRGPCPGLNTLANHGYLPRDGVATFEEIVTATGVGFNMDRSLSSALTAFAMLARGNTYLNKISIGGPTDKIPALPGNIDGNMTKGLATHGRFEGDVSFTRRDDPVGDNVNLNPDLFDLYLSYVAQYGNDSEITGPKSVVSHEAIGEFKYRRFVDDQKENPGLIFHQGRMELSYGEGGFQLSMFANGTTGELTVPILKSIFQNQTFPENWHRRGTPADFELVGDLGDLTLGYHPEVVAGQNAANGTYIPDPPFPIPHCAVYTSLAVEAVPAGLVNTTGILKQNVDFLLQTIHDGFSDCEFTLPTGEADV